MHNRIEVIRPCWVTAALLGLFGISLAGASASAAAPAEHTPTHGLWVWRASTVLTAQGAAEALRDFCRGAGINEVYVAVSERGDMSGLTALDHVIDLMHRSGIRIEALLSSENADESGRHRDKLLGEVRAVLRYNAEHSRTRFDGIHLDIEPQQRPENKGPGNLKFLPGLLDTFRAVRGLIEPSGLGIDADIPNKLLRGSAEQRRMLLSSLPRLTLMLYEVSGSADAGSTEQSKMKLREATTKSLELAYEGLPESTLAKMAVGLRTPDYADQLPAMLAAVDASQHDNPHYQGWARHSYNDTLATVR